MVPALLLVLGCWRPDAYTPPSAPPEYAAEVAPDEAPDDAPDEGTDEPPDVNGAPGNPGADDVPEDPSVPDELDAPVYLPAYPARTLQAPVTLVDDYGKPLVVLNEAGVALEVRGEEGVRTRVWCGSCTPAVEGWIQAHLVERTN